MKNQKKEEEGEEKVPREPDAMKIANPPKLRRPSDGFCLKQRPESSSCEQRGRVLLLKYGLRQTHDDDDDEEGETEG